MKKEFVVTDKLHIFKMNSPWFYIPIPKNKIPNVKTGGWGSIPVNAQIGKTKWRTSLFPIKKDNYFIPIKKAVREKENLFLDEKLTVRYKVV